MAVSTGCHHSTLDSPSFQQRQTVSPLRWCRKSINPIEGSRSTMPHSCSWRVSRSRVFCSSDRWRAGRPPPLCEAFSLTAASVLSLPSASWVARMRSSSGFNLGTRALASSTL